MKPKYRVSLTLVAVVACTMAILSMGASEDTTEGKVGYSPPAGVEIADRGLETPRTTTPSVDLVAGDLHRLRVKKCRRLMLTFADYGNSRSSFEPHIEFFVTEHERLGMPGAWYWSLVYGYSNFGLRCYASAPGNCRGPLDVKGIPLAIEPEDNIRRHCAEMHGFWKRGVRGRDLCESVFYPASPFDWDKDRDGRGRFERNDAKFKACIARGYEYGKLP